MKTLLKIKLLGLFKKSFQINKKQKVLKSVFFALLILYGLGASTVLFYFLFDYLLEPFHFMNLDWLYFGVVSIIIVSLCFIGSIFTTQQEIYDAKDNELLLAMPVKPEMILVSRIAGIMVLNYVLELIVCIPALIVYFKYMSFDFLCFIFFLIVMMTLPFLIMTLTLLFSWIITNILNRLPYKNFMLVVLWMIFFGLYFAGVNSIQSYIISLVENGKTLAIAIEQGLFPIYHLSIAVADKNVGSLIFYLLSVFIPFSVVFYLLTVNFMKMATSPKKQKRKVYREKRVKEKADIYNLYIREMKHFFSNVMLILNGMTGTLMMIIGCIAMIYYQNDLRFIIRQYTAFHDEIVAIAVLFSASTSAMNILSSSLISLEGKTLWILKSLPVQTKDILLSKLLVHMTLALPGAILFAILFTMLFDFTLFDMMILIIIPVLLSMISGYLGLIFNLWKPRFDWVNEITCVKQSFPVFLTMVSIMVMIIVIVYSYVAVFYKMISMMNYMYIISIIWCVFIVVLHYLLMNYGIKKWNQLA